MINMTVYGCSQAEAILFREMEPRFDITLTITAMAVSENTASLARGNQCISVNHKTQITPSILRALSRSGVAYISTRSSGYDHIDVDCAKSVGIRVENVMYSRDSVADHTVMLILMAIRDAGSIVNRTTAHDFRLPNLPGKELRDMTVGVIGTGRIGTAVIDRLRGFGCRIVTYGYRSKTSTNSVSLDELLQQSDIVTLHAPLTTQTHHLLNHRRLMQMKRGAFIINAGRGALLDTKALIVALESGQLGGAALDVIEGEEGIFYDDYTDKPLMNKQLLQLQTMPNVLITPHSAYYTEHGLSDMVENSIINCLKFEGSSN